MLVNELKELEEPQDYVQGEGVVKMTTFWLSSFGKFEFFFKIF